MKACVLYSGGKDSSLMAVMLEKLGYQVDLVYTLSNQQGEKISRHACSLLKFKELKISKES